MKYCLCYSSKESSPFDKQELSQHILECFKRNKEKKIDSVFIYNKGYILQKFIGKKEVVQELFQKIKSDKRHYHITLRYEGNIEDSMIDQKHLLGFDTETWDQLNDLNNSKFQEEVAFQKYFQGSKSYIDEILKSEVSNKNILSLDPLELTTLNMEERVQLAME